MKILFSLFIATLLLFSCATMKYEADQRAKFQKCQKEYNIQCAHANREIIRWADENLCNSQTVTEAQEAVFQYAMTYYKPIGEKTIDCMYDTNASNRRLITAGVYGFSTDAWLQDQEQQMRDKVFPAIAQEWHARCE